jgi:hypothetical protein
VVAGVWIPIAAELIAANQADNESAPRLQSVLPPAAHFVLGDTAYSNPELCQGCAAMGRILITPRRFALGAIIVYQLALWYRVEHGMDLRVGLKALLKAA